MKKIILLCLILIAAALFTAQINNPTSTGAATWGLITGTLSSQTDLQTALNAKAPALLSAQAGNTDTVACPNNTTSNFATTYTIPANYLVANKVIRVTLSFLGISSASPPSEGFLLKIGASTVYQANVGLPGSGLTTGMPISVTFLIQGSAVASASAAVYTHPNVLYMGNTAVFTPFSSVNGTGLAQPINLATNGTLVVQPVLFCSLNTAGNSLTLQQMIVEALN